MRLRLFSLLAALGLAVLSHCAEYERPGLANTRPGVEWSIGAGQDSEQAVDGSWDNLEILLLDEFATADTGWEVAFCGTEYLGASTYSSGEWFSASVSPTTAYRGKGVGPLVHNPRRKRIEASDSGAEIWYFTRRGPFSVPVLNAASGTLRFTLGHSKFSSAKRPDLQGLDQRYMADAADVILESSISANGRAGKLSAYVRGLFDTRRSVASYEIALGAAAGRWLDETGAPIAADQLLVVLQSLSAIKVRAPARAGNKPA